MAGFCWGLAGLGSSEDLFVGRGGVVAEVVESEVEGQETLSLREVEPARVARVGLLVGAERCGEVVVGHEV